MKYLIAMLVLLVSAPAWADCDGSPKGRWRLWVNHLDIMCTLVVTRNGRIVPQDSPENKCQLTISSNITGGRLSLNDPLPNTMTDSKQCFVSGKMRIAGKPPLVFKEVWIGIGNNAMKGIGSFGKRVVMIEAWKY